MKNILFRRFLMGCLLLSAWWAPLRSAGQCNLQVFHTSGTQVVGCSEVLVTSEGFVGEIDFCGESPYRIGSSSFSGSYTFTFDPPVNFVTLGLTAIDDQPNIFAREEVRFEINGTPYPIPAPGTPPIVCYTSAVLTPSGAVTGPPNGTGAWATLDIATSISTLKVENFVVEGTPNGSVFSLYICSPCCETDAGALPTQNLQACTNEPASFNHDGNEVLDFNDLLQFILFSDLNDTLGSIIATSSDASFVFNPATMQTGTTYYVAAIAGNNAGGNVDLNDPCLDVSNAVELVWQPLPEVSLAVDGSTLCPGLCATVTATFTGTPPFTLQYVVPGENPTQITFPATTGTFPVCVPPNTPAGSFTVQSTFLSDAQCSCF